ncbi:MAG TPA: hypothetical protein VK947_01625 [Planococcus sp. (in: firmicutes)]|nr:hypothetical protein [Planococcus sp. (in: firmicutes)]
MKKKYYTYRILLTTGEWLEEIRIEGPLEDHFSGVNVSFFPVQDAQERTIVLSMFHIVKAELLKVEE